MDPMSSVPRDVPPAADGDEDTSDERSERLLRRWLREREARHEAERIAEQGLRRLYEANADLDRRVVERTAELDAARSAAESADRTKTEFLASLGHEVRTPLHTILATLELATPVDDADRRRLDDATGATRALRDLFTNLLELAQFEVGTARTHVRPMDLAAVIDDLVDRWRSPLAAAGLLLVPDSPVGSDAAVVTDGDRVVQMLDALLDNAMKYATPGTVRLSVTTAGGAFTLRVADDGPGIDDDLLDKVFEPFARAASGTDRPAGSGVGLALVRRIAEHLGGTAHAERSGSGGLEIVVALPGGGAPDRHDPGGAIEEAE